MRDTSRTWRWGPGRTTTAMAATGALMIVGVGSAAIGQTPSSPTPYPADEQHAPSPVPDRVVLTPTAEPATSQSVSWRTSAEFDVARAQILETLPGPSETRGGPRLDALAKTVAATSEQLQADLGYASSFHTATFSGLEPSTSYLYRVGDGQNWSPWYEFETAAVGFEPFSFIYYGDAQNDVREHVSRVFRRAFADKPDADLIVHAGDLVNTADADAEWGEWFEAAGWVNGMRNILATPGNHEYRSGELSPQWRPQFEFPDNGPEGGMPIHEALEETVYHLDYQGVRFVSLNTAGTGSVPQDAESQQAYARVQAEYLDEVLEDNPHKWSVVFFHHPVFSVAEGRSGSAVRAALLDVLEKHQVDLVLQGHDHTYGRGNLDTAQRGNSQVSDGTVYVVSVSGPKMYEVDGSDWEDNEATLKSTAENTQLYQLIDVTEDELRYEARTATGEFHDGFILRKPSKDGTRTVTDLTDPR